MPAGQMSLDEVDRRLVAELIADGRVSVNELATRAHVSRATAYSRFERLRDAGVVRGFTTDADPAALGYGLAVLILINVEQGQWLTPSHRACRPARRGVGGPYERRFRLRIARCACRT